VPILILLFQQALQEPVLGSAGQVPEEAIGRIAIPEALDAKDGDDWPG
jgi:hypothetical protein